MKEYQKRPIIIQAQQWFEHGDIPEVKEVPRWHEEAVITAIELGAHLSSWGFIDTLEGGHLVRPGDWIVKGIRGEFYPVKNGIFQETYEEVQK